MGCDFNCFDSVGIVRVGLESLVENISDGVMVFIFWGVVLGFFGFVGYKVINMLDFMVGYKNEVYVVFGGFVVCVDDFVNFILV